MRHAGCDGTAAQTKAFDKRDCGRRGCVAVTDHELDDVAFCVGSNKTVVDGGLICTWRGVGE